MEESAFFEVLRTIALWLTPLVFIEGVLLLVLRAEKYSKLENYLAKEIGGMRKRVAPRLERNIYSFHNWLLKRTPVVGTFCVIYAFLLFVVLSK